MAFELDIVVVPISSLLPLRQIAPRIKRSVKYRQIRASMKAVGIIEPPVVTPAKGQKGKYLLLDGHLRLEILKEMEEKEVACLISTDDEAFTYNKRINRISTIEEHKMILKVIEHGLPDEYIAKALDVDVKSITQRKNLLNGICKEVADLLKDKHVPVLTFGILKRMLPVRQIEVVMLMNESNSHSLSYARILLAATPKDQLVNPAKPKGLKGLSPETTERMEHELTSLQRDFDLIKKSYGIDMMTFVFARGYVASLLENRNVAHYLRTKQPDFLKEFRRIADMTSVSEQDMTV
jgi:hypothetical protein